MTVQVNRWHWPQLRPRTLEELIAATNDRMRRLDQVLNDGVVYDDRATTFSQAVSGSFYDRGGALFNLRHPDFGVKADGVANDRAAINAAIAAVNAAGGGILWAPPGNYGLGAGGGILMMTNVIVMGCGRASRFFALNGTNPTHLFNFEANSPTDAGVVRCLLDGNRANQAAGTDLIVVGLAAARILIERCLLRDSYAHAVNVNGTVNTGEAYILHNTLEGVIGAVAGADMGIRIHYPSLVAARHQVIGNRVPWTAGFGVALTFVDGALVALNHVKGDGTGATNEAYNIDRSRRCIIANNYGGFRADFGLTLHSSGSDVDPNEYHTVVGNIFENCKDAGVVLAELTRFCTVSGNVVRNCALAAPAGQEAAIIVDTGVATAKPAYNMIGDNVLVDDQGVPTCLVGVLVNNGNCEDNMVGPNVVKVGGTNEVVRDNGLRTRFVGAIGGFNTPANLAAGANNDYAVGNFETLRLTGDAGGTSVLNGFAGGFNRRKLRVINVGAVNIGFGHQQAGSAAANRIITPTAAQVNLPGVDDVAEFEFDPISARWRLVNVQV